MNRYLQYGMAVAAAALVMVVAVNLLPGSSTPGGDPSATPDASASVEPSPSGGGSLPVGPHVMDPPEILVVTDDSVTVTIPAPGWFADPDAGSVTKDLGGGNRVTVMVVPADYYQVPASMCDWRTNLDGDPAATPNRSPGTVDEMVNYLAEQTYLTEGGSALREFSSPVEVTIDGYAGQSISGVVPSDPAGCDEQRFCSIVSRDGYPCVLPHPEPGALTTVWVVNPGDASSYLYLRLFTASYWPATDPTLLAEMNAIVDSIAIHIEE